MTLSEIPQNWWCDAPKGLARSGSHSALIGAEPGVDGCLKLGPHVEDALDEVLSGCVGVWSGCDRA